MFSNSKLTASERFLRKDYLYMLAEFGGAVFTSVTGRVTIAFMPEFRGSRMLQVAVSYASPDENKIRRKVGEYHALEKLFSGNYILLPDGFDPEVLVETIDNNVEDHGWVYE